MLTSIDDLKSFIIWCKQEGVESVTIQGCEFKLAPIAHLGLAERYQAEEAARMERDAERDGDFHPFQTPPDEG